MPIPTPTSTPAFATGERIYASSALWWSASAILARARRWCSCRRSSTSRPGTVLHHLHELLVPGGSAYISTPNVLTLAPRGASHSGNPWHLSEYRHEEFLALCQRAFPSVLCSVFTTRASCAARAGASGSDGIAPSPAWDHGPLLQLVHARDSTRTSRCGPSTSSARSTSSRFAPELDRAPGASRRRGQLALVLHTHMPYVEGGAPWPRPAEEHNPLGFGTWPFGEEWLWEAVATSYLPLLGVLGRAPITLSLTPVLCDQLESPGALGRCVRFLEEVRPESHRRDIVMARERGEDALVAVLERSAASLRRGRRGAAGAPARSAWGAAARMRAGLPPPPMPCCPCSSATPPRRYSSRMGWRPTGGGSGPGAAGCGCPSADTPRGSIRRSPRPA